MTRAVKPSPWPRTVMGTSKFAQPPRLCEYGTHRWPWCLPGWSRETVQRIWLLSMPSWIRKEALREKWGGGPSTSPQQARTLPGSVMVAGVVAPRPHREPHGAVPEGDYSSSESSTRARQLIGFLAFLAPG